MPSPVFVPGRFTLFIVPAVHFPGLWSLCSARLFAVNPGERVEKVLTGIIATPPAVRIVELCNMGALAERTTTPVTRRVVRIFIVPGLSTVNPIEVGPEGMKVDPATPEDTAVLSFPEVCFTW